MKIPHTTPPVTGRSAGFSLLEVMISIMVTAIGLLGLAGLQAAGLRSNVSAYHNSQAAVLAYDLADRMRSNIASITLYPVTVAEQVAACDSTGCSSSDMVKHDLFAWNAELTAAIPSATGTVTAAGNTYTISVRWDDDRDGDIDAEDPNFQVAFQP